MSWKKVILVLTVLALALSVTACGGGEEPAAELEKVTLMLDWVPNTNHTGLYVAQEKGFFAEQGLEVEFLEPSQGGVPQMVASGQVLAGISFQEQVTDARSNDIPIVSIGAIIQHNTSGFISLKEAGINSPADFEGKRYGGWGMPMEEAVITALMDKHGADWSKVKNITIGEADPLTILGKDADFEWIYYGWEGIQAQLRGLDFNYINLKDQDPKFDYYTPVFIASEDTIAQKPEQLKAFMAAVAQGYQYAIEHPEESAEILLTQVPELDPELVKKSQAWLSPQYQADAPRWGEQKAEVWKTYADWMFEQGLIPNNIESDKAFTNQFLPE
jgi:ABC-type nitrate/sulfonate/bicarbonate transport system substrate-binding protein